VVEELEMENFYPRTVFFVKDAERSLAFYTERLGFKVDWSHQDEGRTSVFQVSLFGFELIVNQVDPAIETKAGKGRVFLGLEDDQVAALRRHCAERQVEPSAVLWGAPTLALYDLDGNEIYAWMPRGEWSEWEAKLKQPEA
jgi:catechol 2,3-dioxygenase-like lactoylglutathione lyase family enzyme